MRLIDADALKEEFTCEGDEWINNIIDSEPTIDAVSEWIPCSDRLPSEDGKYLIVGRQGAVNILPYHDGMWYGRWGVIAWMPLPKPYERSDT